MAALFVALCGVALRDSNDASYHNLGDLMVAGAIVSTLTSDRGD